MLNCGKNGGDFLQGRSKWLSLPLNIVSALLQFFSTLLFFRGGWMDRFASLMPVS